MATFYFQFGRSTSTRDIKDYFFYSSGTYGMTAAISSGLVDLFPKEVKRSFDNKKVNVLAFNESKFWFALYSDGNSRGGLKTDWDTEFVKRDKPLEDYFTRVLGPKAVFGPDGTFVAWANQSSDLPDNISRWPSNSGRQGALMRNLLGEGKSALTIAFVALGVNSSYYIKYATTPIRPDVSSFGDKEYATLRKWLATGVELAYLSLHPSDPAQYIAQDKTGFVRASVSSNIYDLILPILQKEKKTKAIPDYKIDYSDSAKAML